MRRFWVYQIREKEARKKCVSSRTHSNKRAKCVRHCIHGGYEKFFAALAVNEHWLGLRAARSKVSLILSLAPKSQRCAHILCQATQQSMSRQTEVSRSITSATNACEVDVQDMDVLQDIGLGSSTDLPLKREPQSDKDKCNQRVNEFLAKLVTLLRTLQDQSNAFKALILEASKNKFVSQLSGDFDAFLRMLMRVIKVVEESVTSPPARYDIQKLLKMVDELDVWSLPLKDACTAFLASRTPVKDPSAELE